MLEDAPPGSTLKDVRAKLERSKPIIRLKRPSHWIAWAALALVGALLVELIFTNPNWQWDITRSYLFAPDVMGGLLRTIILALLAMVGGLILGLVVALMRLSSNPVFRLVSLIYLWVIRAIPVLVLLLFTYFLAALIPRLALGVPFGGPEFFSVSTNDVITKFSAALICLVVVESAYMAEVIRGGILSVSTGQREAAMMLGMSNWMMMRRVVLPQSFRVMLPGLGNQFVTLFKNTSLVSFIGYAELLTTVQNIYERTYQIVPLLMVACIWYLVLTSIAMLGQSSLEKRFSKGTVKIVGGVS